MFQLSDRLEIEKKLFVGGIAGKANTDQTSAGMQTQLLLTVRPWKVAYSETARTKRKPRYHTRPELVLIRVLMTSLENKVGPFFSTLECQKFVRRFAKVTKKER